ASILAHCIQQQAVFLMWCHPYYSILLLPVVTQGSFDVGKVVQGIGNALYREVSREGISHHLRLRHVATSAPPTTMTMTPSSRVRRFPSPRKSHAQRTVKTALSLKSAVT